MLESHHRYHSFKDDYSEGAHPRILEALQRHNTTQEAGYGLDQYCRQAIALLRDAVGQPHAQIHFTTGGTQTNVLVLHAILKSFESVVAAASAHIAVHETGAIEATGHKIHTVPTATGRLTVSMVEQVVRQHVDEHMVVPKAVFISQPTEYGTLYTRGELELLSGYCRDHGMYLYVDGARLGMALTARDNDVTIQALAKLVDVFYIGGTKNGGLLGEAVVFTNNALAHHFRYYMKQKGALIAKSRVLGLQFMELFRDQLYYDLGNVANVRATTLADGIRQAGYSFWIPPTTNQLFPVFPADLVTRLKNKYDFYEWTTLEGDQVVIRLVTSWATTEEVVQEFINDLEGK